MSSKPLSSKTATRSLRPWLAAGAWLFGLPATTQADGELTLAEAVRTTLEVHPEVRLGQQAAGVQRGAAIEAGGLFDTYLGASVGHEHQETPLLESSPLRGDEIRTDATTLQLSSTTTTRWGMRIEPMVSLQRLHQRITPDVAGLSEQPQHAARVGLLVTQSLLRDAGQKRMAGQETAARQQAEAARVRAGFVGASQALQTVLAYWLWVAANQELALFGEAEQRAQQLLEDTRALVKADQRPAADLRQVEGNLVDRQRQRVQAEAGAFEAQRLLGLAMGIQAADMDGLERAAHGLPASPADADRVLERDDVHVALSQRLDLSAAETTLRAAVTLEQAARGNRLPALELSMGASYTGLSEDTGPTGYFGALAKNVPGPSYNALLSLELPVRNRRLEGAHQQRAAERNIAHIARDEQRRQIETRVRVARNNLIRAVQALQYADRAAALYAQAVEDERAKLAVGAATIIDVIVVQDRLLLVQREQLGAKLGFAEALARYHFEMGALPGTLAELDTARLSPLLGPAS